MSKTSKTKVKRFRVTRAMYEKLLGEKQDLLDEVEDLTRRLNQTSEDESNIRIAFRQSQEKVEQQNQSISGLKGNLATAERELAVAQGYIARVRESEVGLQNMFDDSFTPHMDPHRVVNHELPADQGPAIRR